MKPAKSKFVIDNLDLKLNRDSDSRFSGHLKLDGQKVGRPSQRITLSQKGLRITSAEITHTGKNGETVHELIRINHLKKRSEVRLHAKSMLYPGKYSLSIDYWGHVTGQIESEVFNKNEFHITDLAKLNLDQVLLNSLIPHVINED